MGKLFFMLVVTSCFWATGSQKVFILLLSPTGCLCHWVSEGLFNHSTGRVGFSLPSPIGYPCYRWVSEGWFSRIAESPLSPTGRGFGARLA